MKAINRILVIQTAFIGDVILTLPLIQVLKEFVPKAEIDVVVVPRAAELCRNHPAIERIIEYDKRGKDKGWAGFRRMVGILGEKEYQIAVLPHRSLRSALLAFLAGIPLRIGFSKGAGRFLLTKSIDYETEKHEVERNLSLLTAIGIRDLGKVLPRVYPSRPDQEAVSRIMSAVPVPKRARVIAVAPGTIWNTKRWMKERFVELINMIVDNGFAVVLVGGKEDRALCNEILEAAKRKSIINAAGSLTLLESAELLSRCRLTISNDSAPMHLSVAVGTPVVAIFGATVPSFGFSPYGPHDAVVETRGLHCRPCSIHGGTECPIKTFDCMVQITPERVFSRMMDVLEKTGAKR
ncbi:MAG TPA: lipopolysaccharide heptosyltransferase II [Bacteroidota bacterium]|nr:lipopolysaccharide heptosyltransferase II [Bacteroidota bacterium]